jgi:hypothetical protein
LEVADDDFGRRRDLQDDADAKADDVAMAKGNGHADDSWWLRHRRATAAAKSTSKPKPCAGSPNASPPPMSDGKLQYEIEIAGTDQAAAGLGDVEAGLDRIASSEKRLSDNSTSFSRDIDSSTTNMSKGAYAAESSFGRFASYLGGRGDLRFWLGLTWRLIWSKIKSEAEESERKIKEVSAAIREMVGDGTPGYLSAKGRWEWIRRGGKFTHRCLTKEEARAQVPLMERNTRVHENRRTKFVYKSGNYKKFIEGGGNIKRVARRSSGSKG